MSRKIRAKSIWCWGVLIGIGILLFGVYGYYIMVYRQSTEPDAGAYETNTDAAIYESQEQIFILKNFKEMYHLLKREEKDLIILPGLKSTRTIKENNSKKISVCTSMTPQGLCTTEEFLLVSAYCSARIHNSIIYVIEKETNQFIKEIILKDKNHVGGLAYDQGHQIVWVSSEYEKSAAVSAIMLNSIKEYELHEPVSYLYEYKIPDLKQNSFLTYANECLYIGEFSMKENSILHEYKIEEDGSIDIASANQMINQKHTWELPSRIQGIAISGDYLILAQSYGWTPSWMMVYRKSKEGLELVKKIKMPQKLQQISIDSENLYVLFESAAYAYRAQPLPKVDRILKLRLQEVLTIGF